MTTAVEPSRTALLPSGVWLALRNIVEPYVVAKFVVPGNPFPKRRPRTVGKVTFTPKVTKAAEKRVQEAFRRAMPDWTEPEPDGTYGCLVQFNTETGSTVDLDNAVKLIWDALNGVFWVDDVQVGTALINLVRGGDPDTEVWLFPTENNGTRPTVICACGARYRSKEKQCHSCTKARRATNAQLAVEQLDPLELARFEHLQRAAMRFIAVQMMGTDRSPALAKIGLELGITEHRAREVVDSLIKRGCLARRGPNGQLQFLRPWEPA